MSLFESGDSSGSVSLQNLLAGQRLEPQKSALDLDRSITLTLRGGWPALAGTERPSSNIPRQYLERIADSEASNIDGIRRNPSKLMAVIKSLARNNATLVNNATIQRDIEPEAEDSQVNRNTLAVYLALLKSLYILEEIPGWDPGLRSTKRLRVSPKRLLTEPSLAAAALDATQEKLKKDLRTFGFLFEGLCIRDVSIYAELMGASLYHYRDESGLEADIILEMADGRWAALEIKLGAHQIDAAAEHLKKLGDKMKKNAVSPPASLIVISGLAGFAHQREDGVCVVPIDCLKP
jgi:predicted AAA+ superfamily ATPase